MAVFPGDEPTSLSTTKRCPQRVRPAMGARWLAACALWLGTSLATAGVVVRIESPSAVVDNIGQATTGNESRPVPEPAPQSVPSTKRTETPTAERPQDLISPAVVTERTKERTNERPGDPVVDRAIARSADRAAVRAIDRAIEASDDSASARIELPPAEAAVELIPAAPPTPSTDPLPQPRQREAAAITPADHTTLPTLLTLSDSDAPLALWPQVRISTADHDRANPDALLGRLNDFVRPEGPAGNLGRVGKPVWLHMAMQVDASSDGQWLLVLNHAPLNDARVFVYEDGFRVAQHRLGSFQPFADRPLPTRTHAAPLSLRPGARVDILLRVSTRTTLLVPMSLEKPGTLLRAEGRAQLLQGLFFGLALAMLAYSLAQAYATRERMFAAYAMLMAGGIGLFIVNTGLGQQHLWEEQSTGLAAKLSAVFALLMAAAAASFLRHALATKKNAPIVDGLLRALAIMALAGLAVAPLTSIAYEDLQKLARALGPLVVAVGLPAVWQARRSGETGATSLLVGWSFYLVGMTCTALMLEGWISANVLSQNILQATHLIEMMAWMHALALRARSTNRKAAHAITERNELEWMAKTDDLTGLSNRRGLSLALSDALRKRSSQRPATLLAVYLIDLDGFKTVNDQHGHPVGDLLLARVGARLHGLLRARDLVARLGGDEFVVLADAMPDSADVHALGHKLLAAFREPFDIDGITCTVGATIGYAVSPDHGDDGAQLMRYADIALYEGKQEGRRQLVRYDAPTQPMHDEAPAPFSVQVQRVATPEARRVAEEAGLV